LARAVAAVRAGVAAIVVVVEGDDEVDAMEATGGAAAMGGELVGVVAALVTVAVAAVKADEVAEVAVNAIVTAGIMSAVVVGLVAAMVTSVVIFMVASTVVLLQ
jgi:hypothetical protein